MLTLIVTYNIYVDLCISFKNWLKIQGNIMVCHNNSHLTSYCLQQATNIQHFRIEKKQSTIKLCNKNKSLTLYIIHRLNFEIRLHP